ncbi:MAG: class I SAM-dependent methyltransferase [Candidatus Latescibacterota bacterium]|nr:class I SAM-dependent methyltransferase [Candidatus Latescibacterota bacterium]
MALADFTGPNRIDDWIADLHARWPERHLAAKAVVDAIRRWAATTGDIQLRILELGVGSGHLAEGVLAQLRETGKSTVYVGVDVEPDLILFTATRLKDHGHAIDMHVADLNNSDWATPLGRVDIAFTLQSLHDLAGLPTLTKVYRQLFNLLRSGGLLVNADFIVPFDNDDPHQPRRFPVEQHRKLLEEVGFTEFTASAPIGKLACMSAIRGPVADSD